MHLGALSVRLYSSMMYIMLNLLPNARQETRSLFASSIELKASLRQAIVSRPLLTDTVSYGASASTKYLGALQA